MSLPNKVCDEVSKLQVKTGARSKADVVSMSLSLSNKIIEMLQNGDQFYLENPDGSIDRLRFVGIDC